MGDDVYMVRTGTGPNGQPSYTPMNMADGGSTKALGAKSKKRFDDELSSTGTNIFRIVITYYFKIQRGKNINIMIHACFSLILMIKGNTA